MPLTKRQTDEQIYVTQLITQSGWSTTNGTQFVLDKKMLYGWCCWQIIQTPQSHLLRWRSPLLWSSLFLPGQKHHTKDNWSLSFMYCLCTIRYYHDHRWISCSFFFFVPQNNQKQRWLLAVKKTNRNTQEVKNEHFWIATRQNNVQHTLPLTKRQTDKQKAGKSIEGEYTH